MKVGVEEFLARGRRGRGIPLDRKQREGKTGRWWSVPYAKQGKTDRAWADQAQCGCRAFVLKHRFADGQVVQQRLTGPGELSERLAGGEEKFGEGRLSHSQRPSLRLIPTDGGGARE